MLMIRAAHILLLAMTALSAGIPSAPAAGPAHYHDYWGGLGDVDVFYGTMDLDASPLEPAATQCGAPSSRSFDLESDGDDVTPLGSPVNPSPIQGVNPKADAVFPGTDRLTVTLHTVDVPSGDLFLRWHHARTSAWTPSECGIVLTPDTPLVIPVSASETDLPHAWSVSGWGFALFSDGGPGTVTIQIAANHGRPLTVDAGHADLYGDSDVYDLGCAHGSVNTIEGVSVEGLPVANRPPGGRLTDIQFPYGRIVPILTDRVEVRLEMIATGPNPSAALDLRYHAADTNAYEPAPAPTPSGAGWVVIIPDPQGILADSPYAETSAWRFELAPRPIAPSLFGERAAAFEGSYELCATAHRAQDGVLAL